MNSSWPKILVFWLGIVVILVLAANMLKTDKRDTLPLNEFKRYLDNGQITEVDIYTNKLLGKYLLTSAARPEGKGNRASLDNQREFELAILPEQVPWITGIIYQHQSEHPESTVKYESHPPQMWMVSALTTFLPVLLLVGVMIFVLKQMQVGGTKAMSFGKSRARLSTGSQNKVTFDDVAGCDEAKEDLQEIVEFLKDPQKYQRLGGKIPKGVLLSGPPGTGKTLLARAVAGEANVPFFSISGSDFVEMFVGVGASRVRDLFDQGKKNAPCIIFIDEIDAVGRQRFAGFGGGHDEREQTLNQLLVEMDGFNSNEGVILIAATNREDTLDQALMRPGRFDRRIVVDIPDRNGRHGILKVHSKVVETSPDVDLEVLARRTPGFSGADLANVVNEAALLAARHNKDKVGMSDFEEAVDKVIAGAQRKSRVITDKEKRVVAYHEAGHALMFIFIDEVDPLHKVSILPRGRFALGYTLNLPTEDKYLRSREEILGTITALLGGRVAEELFIKQITTGAQSDLDRATMLARSMVCEFGMSTRLGPISFNRNDGNVFLGRDFGRVREYSEEIAFEIDKEVRHIIDECYSRARDLLTLHSEDMEKLAQALLEREVMDVDEVMVLLGLQEPAPPAPADTPKPTAPPAPAVPSENAGGEFGAAPGFPHHQPT